MICRLFKSNKMKLQLTLLYSAILLGLISCHKEIKSEKGGIDIISNVYFNASKGLNQMQSFHISKMSYSEDQLIEIVPDRSFPEINKRIFLIKDSVYYPLDSADKVPILSEITHQQKPLLIWNKKEGAVFSKEQIPNYNNRRDLTDTVLFGKQYRRFEINSPWNYTRFYIFPTDTILPYTLYRHAEIDYHGRLERIDSYSKKSDIFVTLQLIPRKNWDKEAKELFDYNHFAISAKSK